MTINSVFSKFFYKVKQVRVCVCVFVCARACACMHGGVEALAQ